MHINFTFLPVTDIFEHTQEKALSKIFVIPKLWNADLGWSLLKDDTIHSLHSPSLD